MLVAALPILGAVQGFDRPIILRCSIWDVVQAVAWTAELIEPLVGRLCALACGIELGADDEGLAVLADDD